MVKTILAVLIAAVPAGAAEFGLERTGAADLFEAPVIEASAPQWEKSASRLSAGEIENRWIAAIFVAGRNLDGIAASAQGVSPHAAPAGYAVSLGILADRTAAAAESMHYAWLDRRWHIVANEANKLDRVAADLRDWAAQAKAHHNASALRAGDLARAAADLSSALQWLRADSAQLRKSPQPAVLPVYEFDLDCRGEGLSLTGRLSRKGGQLRVASAPLYQQFGGEGENLRFFPETGSAPERSAFLSSDSAFFNYTLDLPGSALARPGEFAAALTVSFDDESARAFDLKCSTR